MLRNAFEGLATESTQQSVKDGIDTLATESTQQALKASIDALGPLTDAQLRAIAVLVALDQPTLAALETVTVANPTDVSSLATSADILGLHERIGSSGLGVPEEGTVTALLRGIRAAAENIALDADNLAINADTINLSTDQLEAILNSIGAAIGTTTDTENTDTLIGRVKAILAGQPPLTLTGRMLDKKPAAGYEMWVDSTATVNLGPGVIMAEAPAAQADTAQAVWRGVFIPTAGGRWVERTGFAWASRTTGWS